MTSLAELVTRLLNNAADAPVALTRTIMLEPVEGEGAVIFPPTFASRTPYVIDTLADGTKVALIDTVGSQANRMEPIFKEPPYAELVPQITIRAGNRKEVSIFDVGHRVADALVRSSRFEEADGSLAEKVHDAFGELARDNAGEMAKLAPTSLVFGVWDSRGEGMKVPRLINSVIRAHDVSELHRAAQYMPALMPEDYRELAGFDEKELQKAEGDPKAPMAKAGFVPVPSVDDPGGVIAKGDIRRDVTVNLVALRRLRAGAETEALQRYILGLALVAATYPQDGFLRQGCLLVEKPEKTGPWRMVHRDGRREDIELTHEAALAFAREAADAFGVGPSLRAVFDARLAKEVLAQARKQKD
ncbi:MAG TPA: type I-U CRISPR-associated protein Cas7 [Thermopetrobacter sp.]|nr:type I-U CRISPR-associated protein Cas7 [Thermopetrobacter sp.]